MRAIILLTVCVLGLSSPARADLYWVSYEAGGSFPEEEGWQRHAYGGGTQRSFEDGCLVLDAAGVSGIIDEYNMSRPLDPSPGEAFSIEWRLCVNEAEYQDPAVVVSSYGRGAVDLAFTREAVHSVLEHVWIPIEPGLFHRYVLTSSDLVTYHLEIDGQVVHTGQFVGPMWDSIVTWGDTFYGASSVSRWDYVRFGIVPEPSAAALFGLAVLAVTSTRAPRAWRNMP